MKLLPYEIWENIPGFEYHQVSSMGNIRSLDRVITFANGKKQTIKGKPILKQLVVDKRTGYARYMVTLGLGKAGSVKTFRIARLVAQVFIPNPNNLPQINHKDENSLNDQISNLEWCDCKYNNTYGTKIERLRQKHINGKGSKPVGQYTLDGELVKIYPSAGEAGREFNCNPSIISRVCRGIRPTVYGYKWKYL